VTTGDAAATRKLPPACPSALRPRSKAFRPLASAERDLGQVHVHLAAIAAAQLGERRVKIGRGRDVEFSGHDHAG
jgi:hypothetical protein